MHDVLLGNLFLAQTVQASTNAGAGLFMALAGMVCVGGVAFGAWEIAHGRLNLIVPIVLAVVISAMAVAITNSAYHVIGGLPTTITPTSPD